MKKCLIINQALFELLYLCLVMITALDDNDRIILNFINQPMLLINSTRPVACKVMFEWFRFANTLKWVTFDGFNQLTDLFDFLFTGSVPVLIVLPRVFRPR